MQGKITLAAINRAKRKAKAQEKNTYLWDTELKGFGAYVSKHGTVSWLVQKWQGGRKGRVRRITIGRSPPMELKEAREEAAPIINDANKGIDIVRRKALRRLAIKQAPTLGEAIDQYVERKDDGSRYWRENKNRLESLSLDKNLLVHDITKQSLVEELEKRKHGASVLLYSTLRPFFKWCMERDIIVSSPLATIPKPRLLKSRDRILSDDEVKLLWRGTEGLAHPWKSFYRLLLLTGMRRTELATICWHEISEGIATIPKERTKNSKEHIVHLSSFALEQLPKRNNHEFVFKTKGGERPIGAFSRSKRTLDKLTPGIREPWRVHDLRRTCASGMAQLGTPPHIIERILNHLSGVNSGLVGVYQRYEYLQERKDALEAYGEYIRNLAKE